VALEDGTGDAAYLDALESSLAPVFGTEHADLAIYIAGADPFMDDRFGRLALTKEGLAKRDRMVFGCCAGQGIPVAITMGGGYGRKVSDTVEIHLQTVKIAAERSRGCAVLQATGREIFTCSESNGHG
jgi:acetoin utilization deacetylase AcuC-like enzyme